MDLIYEVAGRVSAVMRRKKIGFNSAFVEVMRGYHDINFAETKSKVGKVFSNSSAKKKSKKLGGQLTDAKVCEASLTNSIPADDL